MTVSSSAPAFVLVTGFMKSCVRATPYSVPVPNTAPRPVISLSLLPCTYRLLLSDSVGVV